jgi:2-keto-3-deoxy-L-rhamnonate aldolase RhmA
MTSFLASVAEDRPALGCFSFIASPQVVELLALAGFDYIVIDREHSANDWTTIENMVRAAEARDIAALIRVSDNDPAEILRALDCGADGIVVPGVATADDAAKAIEAMRFPPAGRRGACPASRAADYGAVDYAEFQHQADDSRVLVLLIEEARALGGIDALTAGADSSVRSNTAYMLGREGRTLDEIEAITAGAGSNVAYMIGRSDLAASLGHFGHPSAPPVVEAAESALERLIGAQPDVVAGMGLYQPEEISFWHERGCRFFWYGADASIFMGATRDLVRDLRDRVAA